MGKVDMEKLETAITYLQRIAYGNNPISNAPIGEEDFLNDPSVIRCMYFAKDVLEEVKRNKGYIGGKMPNELKLDFPVEEAVSLFSYKEDKAVTKLVKQINEVVDITVYKQLSYKNITLWLKMNGFLDEVYDVRLKKKITLPTTKGIELGIRAEKRIGSKNEEYLSVIYGKEAQEYIIRNLERILNGELD